MGQSDGIRSCRAAGKASTFDLVAHARSSEAGDSISIGLPRVSGVVRPPPEGIIPRRAKCQLLLHLQLICENFSQLRNTMNARTALGLYRSCIDVFASGATRHKFRGDAAARTGGIPIIGSCKVATSGNRTLSDFGKFL